MSDDYVSQDAGFTYIWKIEYFSFYVKHKALQSPIFVVTLLEDTQWYLTLYSVGETTLGLYLQRYGSDKTKDLKVEYELAYLGADGLPLVTSGKVTGTYTAKNCSGLGTKLDLNDLSTRKSEFLPGDTMTVRCVISYQDKEFQQSQICRARTFCEEEEMAFTWRVRNFSYLRKENSKRIQVKTSDRPHTETTLSMYLDGRTADEKFNLEVTQNESKLLNIFAFKMSLIGPGGKRVDFAEDRQFFEASYIKQTGLFQSFVGKNELMANRNVYLSRERDLILQCKVIMSFGIKLTSVRYEPHRYMPLNPLEIMLVPNSKQEEPHPCMKDDFQTLMSDGFLSDVNLCAGGKQLPAHKCILSARSLVFRAHFTRRMKENSLDIANFGAETVQHLLRYFYSDSIQVQPWTSISQLYEAADEYRVLSLKQKCSDLLKRLISISNVCHLLVLSDQHQDAGLKIFVQDFISENDEKVMQLDKWENLQRDFPQLAFETWNYVHFKLKEP